LFVCLLAVTINVQGDHDALYYNLICFAGVVGAKHESS
jgi:hypothetical protein